MPVDFIGLCLVLPLLKDCSIYCGDVFFNFLIWSIQKNILQFFSLQIQARSKYGQALYSTYLSENVSVVVSRCISMFSIAVFIVFIHYPSVLYQGYSVRDNNVNHFTKVLISCLFIGVSNSQSIDQNPIDDYMHNLFSRPRPSFIHSYCFCHCSLCKGM